MKKNKFSNFGIASALILSAASALIYEVVATEILFFYYIRSSYSLSTVFGVFLAGLGIGSFLIYILKDKIKNSRLFFGLLQIAIAIYSFFILANLENIVLKISAWQIFYSSTLLLLFPAICLGAIFPLAGDIFKKEKKDIIGLVYASDLLGAVVGSFISGFWLVPSFGNHATILVGACLNLLSALIILPKSLKKVCIATFLILALLNYQGPTAIVKGGQFNTMKNNLLFLAYSPYGEVKVDFNSTLYINNIDMCSMQYPSDTSEIKMVDYAVEPLKKSDAKILNIGLGCGLTLKEALTETTEPVDIVEINPQVVLANKFLTNIITDKRVNLTLEDGLKYLRESGKKYDTILIDIEDPTTISSSNLYTVEAFQTVKDSLNPGGTFSLWSYYISKKEFSQFLDVLDYSLKAVFPYVYHYPSVFLATNQPVEGETEYQPVSDKKELNTVDHKILMQIFSSLE